MICPGCETSIQAVVDVCPSCALDLTLLSQVGSMPDRCFNRAVKACRDKDWLTALEALAVTCHLNPTDAGAWILKGKVYIELDQFQRAAACFATAVRLDARNPEPGQALLWLQSQGCEISLSALTGSGS